MLVGSLLLFAPLLGIFDVPAFDAAPQAPVSAAMVARAQTQSKEDSQPEKLALQGKVKECCGLPLSLKEGYRLSFYWLAYESDYAHEAYDTDIYGVDGFWLGRYPSAFVFELKLEGSGILLDGRVVNYGGECNYGMGTCFKVLETTTYPYGQGVQSRKLVPFRSIAVDPRLIPIGSPVYVPELVGLVLPDGTVHDGCLRADDMGSAIKNQKIDFFVESYVNFKYAADKLWWRLKATPHVEEPRCEYLRSGDNRERINQHTDYAHLRERFKQALHRERVSLAKIQRSRQAAKKWLARRGNKSTRRVPIISRKKRAA